MRIGLLYPAEHPTSAANWSGLPKGMADGFSLLGADVVPVPCRIPDWIRIPVGLLARAGGARGVVAHREPVYATARSLAFASALRRVGRLDGLIAMGTDLFDLASAIKNIPIPVVTYDDGTYPLFMRYPDSELARARFPRTAVDLWSKRQGDACRYATAACVSTAWAKASVVADYGVPEERVHAVGMGHRLRTVPEWRDFSTPRYLFVGVDWTRKNGQAVLEAFARVRSIHPSATLDVAGSHPEIRQEGVTGHGYLPREDKEAQKRLDHLFARATAFVLPSLFDPSPIAYLEAASSGLPVIATTSGGAGELLGDAAISVDPRNQDALVRAMLALAAPLRARAMGAAARRIAEDSSWQAVARRIAAILLGSSRMAQQTLAPADRSGTIHG